MQVEEAGQAELSTDALFKTRLDYVMRSFTNAQELVRFMDQKAGYLLTAVGLLTTALGIVAAKALDANANLAWQISVSPEIVTPLKALALVFFITYLVLAFVVLTRVTRVFKALPNSLERRSSAPGLIFPLILLEKYRKGSGADEDSYYSRLLNVKGEDILHDFANQVMEVSEIYQRKQRQINVSIRWFEYLGAAWLVNVLLLLAITILR